MSSGLTLVFSFDQMTPTDSLQMSYCRVTNVPVLHALRDEAVLLGSSFMRTLISWPYLSHMSIPLRVYPFSCSLATPRTLFRHLIRSPYVSKADFIEELNSFMECAALKGCKNMILSDLNLQLDKQYVWSQKFSDSLYQYNFTQIIGSPTHIHRKS